jgi:hypothetical protein
MLPVSISGFAPWLLLVMLAAGIVHHLISKQKQV